MFNRSQRPYKSKPASVSTAAVITRPKPEMNNSAKNVALNESKLPAQFMARRRFVTLTGGVIMGVSLSAVLAACSQDSTSTLQPTASSGSSEAAPATAETTTSSVSSTTPAATMDPNMTMAPGVTMDPNMTMPGSTTASNVAGSNTAANTTTTATTIINNPGSTTGKLFIPPLLEPQVQNGTKIFNLNLQPGQIQFLNGLTTSTLGINGNYLGPTIRAAQGEKVQINVTNHIGEDTTLHWHGLHVPPAMDGGPHQPIASNATWSPQFTVQQTAATLWYHPHLMGQTRSQVLRGLVGMFILDDTNPAQNSLPHTYGLDDIPLIILQQTFGGTGQINVNGGGGGRGGFGGGQTGTVVNGAISPTFSTSQKHLRLRLLNASDQQVFTFGFASNETFYQVASDGGLLPVPASLTRLQLAPAERAEIVVNLNPTTPMLLQSLGGNGGGGGRGGNGGNNPGNGTANTILTIKSSGAASTTPAATLPGQLSTIDRLQAGQAIQTRDMVLAGNDNNPTINNQAMTSMAAMMDMSRALQVKLGSTEVWNIINRSGDTHAFHVHDIQFQILDRNGAAPAANEAGLKDTVRVNPRETVRIIMQFTDFADPNTPYMYHCHILEHEDNGMMGQFLVV